MRSQLLPYINSLGSSESVTEHLQGLLGTGSAAQALTQDVVRYRGFAAKPAAASAARDKAYPSLSNSGRSSPANATLVPPPMRPPGKVYKGKMAKVMRNMALEPPRPIADAGADLSQAFGSGGGKVYRKGDGFEDVEAAYGNAAGKNKGKGKAVEAAPPSIAMEERAAPAEQPRPQPEPRAAAPPKPEAPPREAITPTPEMLAIDAHIEELTLSSAQSTKRRRICFCNGRQHPPHPFLPVCPSCRIVLCTRLVPSPLNVAQGSCPSCGLQPVLSPSSAKHSALLVQLMATRDQLEEQERERIRLLRLERERNKELKKDAAARDEGLFPGLASKGPGPQPKAPAAKTHKVLSLNLAKHTVTEQRQRPKVKAKAKADDAAKPTAKTEEEEEDSMEVDFADEHDPGWSRVQAELGLAGDGSASQRISIKDRPWANWHLADPQLRSLDLKTSGKQADKDWIPATWSVWQRPYDPTEEPLQKGPVRQESAPAQDVKKAVPGAAQPNKAPSKRRGGKGKGKAQEG